MTKTGRGSNTKNYVDAVMIEALSVADAFCAQMEIHGLDEDASDFFFEEVAKLLHEGFTPDGLSNFIPHTWYRRLGAKNNYVLIRVEVHAQYRNNSAMGAIVLETACLDPDFVATDIFNTNPLDDLDDLDD